MRAIDKRVGHFRHFEGSELIEALQEQGFHCLRFIRHGFPMHSLYKRLINNIAPEKVYESFQGGKDYSFLQKLLSQILYVSFYINYLFSKGDQVIILAERK